MVRTIVRGVGLINGMFIRWLVYFWSHRNLSERCGCISNMLPQLVF